jgi:molybdopterin molybdotransferase
VAPLNAVTVIGGMSQLIAPVAPGDGVLEIGGDINAGACLLVAGRRLPANDIATLSSAGVTAVCVRVPRLRIVNTRPGDRVLEAAAAFLARVAESSGATTDMCSDLDQALRTDGADATIAIGGTGAGSDDRSVVTLSRAGSVTCHGIGLLPGETSALGVSNGRPVLLMPGRMDAVLATWLVLGQPLIDRLSGSQTNHVAVDATLTRKVTSSVGFADLILLARNESGVEPLASGYLSTRSLARADGWMLVPAGSEGYPPGTQIEMRPLP